MLMSGDFWQLHPTGDIAIMTNPDNQKLGKDQVAISPPGAVASGQSIGGSLLCRPHNQLQFGVFRASATTGSVGGRAHSMEFSPFYVIVDHQPHVFASKEQEA